MSLSETVVNLSGSAVDVSIEAVKVVATYDGIESWVAFTVLATSTAVIAYRAFGWLGLLKELVRVIENTDQGKVIKAQIASYLTSKSNGLLNKILNKEGLLKKTAKEATNEKSVDEKAEVK